MRRFFLFLLGIFMALILQRLMTERRRQAGETAPEVPAAAEPSAASDQADALTEINGIGPAFEKALNALGIHSFADLARQDPDDLAQRLTTRITAERIRRDAWIEQAQARAGS